MTKDSETPDSNSRRTPEKEDLISAYIEYSEESRYRDGLMHNSYYFVLIAIVLFAGHVLTLNLSTSPLTSPRLGFLVASAGFVTFGIGVVMKTYNRKRINAEKQRQILENKLNQIFTKEGIFKISSNSAYSPRPHDNPFAIQAKVIGETEDYTERFFIDKLSISAISSLMIYGGIVVLASGILFSAGLYAGVI